MKFSRTSTARTRAREVLARDEKALTYLLSAVERRAQAEAVMGLTLTHLEHQGRTRTELATLTGMTRQTVKKLIDNAPDHIDGIDLDKTGNPTTETAFTDGHHETTSEHDDESNKDEGDNDNKDNSGPEPTDNDTHNSTTSGEDTTGDSDYTG